MKIAVIDDDVELRSIIVLSYSDNKTVHLDEFGSAEEFYATNYIEQYDVILLDQMLPGENGLDLLGKIRRKTPAVIMMLSGKNDVSDRIAGLELGAIDYLNKPFHLQELHARIRNHVEAAQQLHPIVNKENIKFSDYIYSLRSYELSKSDSTHIKLTSFEGKALSLLIKYHGQVVTRDHISEEVFDRSWNPSDRSIDMLVGKLRSKLCDAISEPKFIKTIRGKGYVFTAPLK